MRGIETKKEHNFHPKYRPDIDGLRAVAILSVVIFHAFPSVLPGGFVGVDIFFVISGFLISSIIFRSLERDDFSFVEFYAHRIKRIFPALIIVLLSALLLGWFTLLPDEYAQLGRHVAAGSGFVQNFVLWKEAGYFDTASELKPLMHLWSLAVEEQYYLIYPLLILAAWRMRLNVFFLVFILCLLSFILNVTNIDTDATKAFFLPHTRMWELLVGALLAHSQLFRKATFPNFLAIISPTCSRSVSRFASQAQSQMSLVGVFFIFTSICSLNKETTFPGWWALLPATGAWLLIAAGANAWPNRLLLSNRLMIFIGLISYPLYLWHWPILSFARIIENGPLTTEVRLFAIGLSFLLAWLTYRFIETPVRFGKRHWLVPLLLVMLIAGTGYIGYNIADRQGLPFRLKEFSRYYEDFEWRQHTIESCQQDLPEFANGLCSRNKLSPPTLLLLGDSHSDHLYPGLAVALHDSAESIMNIGHNGCLPFADFSYAISGHKDECAETQNAALKFALDHDSVKTVILSFRDPFYNIPNNQARKSMRLLRHPEISSPYLIFESALRETLSSLLQKNKQIIYALDVPEMDFSPRSCVSSLPLRDNNLRKQLCAISRHSYVVQSNTYRKLVLSVLKDYPSVRLFDPSESICDQNYCWAMKSDGTILYRDEHHLSYKGSLLVADKLAITINSLSTPSH